MNGRSIHHHITGVAGFIGSQLADSLLADGHRVSGVDDFSLGREENLRQTRQSDRFMCVEADISEMDGAICGLQKASDWAGQPDLIWHMAANSDIPAGVANATVDFKRTLKTTFCILEAARRQEISNVAFASTSAVHGELDVVLTEDTGPMLPISNYGASKLASEAMLSAAAESFLEHIWIFRFPNVVGPRATHGAIYDFLHRIADGPEALRVLGDGSQEKPYLHVSELIEAMRFIVENSRERRNVFNIGPEGRSTSVKFIASSVIERAAPGLPIRYTGGDRGWVGDVPRFRYSTEKLASLGWRPSLSSDEAVRRAIDELAESILGTAIAQPKPS